MTLLERLREAIGDELMDQVEEAVGDDFNWDFIPKDRFQKVIRQRNTARSKVTELSERLAAAEEDDKDADGDPGSGEKTYTQADFDNLKNDYDSKLALAAKKYAVIDRLRTDGAKDPRLLLTLLDMEKITHKEEDDSLEGYDDQLASQKEARPYLFTSKEDEVGGGTGRHGSSDDESDPTDPFEAVIASYAK